MLKVSSFPSSSTDVPICSDFFDSAEQTKSRFSRLLNNLICCFTLRKIEIKTWFKRFNYIPLRCLPGLMKLSSDFEGYELLVFLGLSHSYETNSMEFIFEHIFTFFRGQHRLIAQTSGPSSLHLDWRSRREVLLPLTESIFHGHETTQLLNNCWSYDDEIWTIK